MKKDCFKIKDLEKRLACLQEKYEKLTLQLSKEFENSVSDENTGVFEIINERVFLLKQIDIVKAQIKAMEQMSKNTKKDRITIGTKARLENHKHVIEVSLVDNNASRPLEGYISVDSPIGRAINGKKEGDKVIVEMPSGKIPYKISKIF